jgi:peroxiredoxin Q/BCP
MSIPNIALPAPAFELPATGDQTLSLSGFEGRNLVVYFSPKDCTPGCTQEGKDFSEHYAEFQALDTDILGVSRDGLKAHENFKATQG